jgi:hypothetical protein
MRREKAASPFVPLLLDSKPAVEMMTMRRAAIRLALSRRPPPAGEGDVPRMI